MLWDLFQQLQLSQAQEHARSVEERMAALEEQVERQHRVLIEIVRHLGPPGGQSSEGGSGDHGAG